MSIHLDTPVLFLIFNRPDTTRQVFQTIRQARPMRLYVAADGPRKSRVGEEERCKITRDIVKAVDWDCQVQTLFREENLGCRRAVSSAINWFFDKEEEGIILEDDCLPDPSFFGFCQDMLSKYRNDDSVMHIGGTNFQLGRTRGDGSYYFSRLAHVWGWASWRRAWRFYDINMEELPAFISRGEIKTVFDDKKTQQYYVRSLKKVYKGVDTWDYQWAFTLMTHKGLSVIPNVNLVTNVGFGAESTHAIDKDDKLANIKTAQIKEIIDPSRMSADREADSFTGREFFQPPPLLLRVQNKLSKVNNNFARKLNKALSQSTG